jgi:glycosyltransferase involved in cell wall biosynthesis
MKICLLVEGSYPYITGGVSAWVHMLISSLPDHQFIIHSIAAEEKKRGQFLYQIPPNVIEVREIFLDAILALPSPPSGRYRLAPWERETLEALICGEGGIDLAVLLQIFRGSRAKSALDIFMSFDFFDVITAAYKRKFPSLPFTDFFWTIRSILLPLFFLIKQELPEADVYHGVATGYAGILGSLGAAVYHKPFVLTEHGVYAREREEEIIKSDWVRTEFKGLWINYFYNLALISYSHAEKVISLFERNRELQVSYGCEPAKTAVIPNGIDVAAYAALRTAERPAGPIVVGAVVRVVPVKDIVTMLRSFALVSRELPDCRFLIVGPTDENPEYFAKCEKLIEVLGLKNITFTGNVQVLNHLKEIDILVLSSISEGQPLAILEGMASGKPWVATDVGSCRELLLGDGDDFGQAGIIVPMLDFEELARAIIELAGNKPLRRQMGENGYRRVAAKYTRERLVAEYQKVYGKYSPQ